MENFLNKFLRREIKDNKYDHFAGYDKLISMETCNFHPFFFSRKTSGFINGGKIPFKNKDVFDLSFNLSFADKKHSLFKEWEAKEPIKTLGELVNVEALIKNMLALDYAINGQYMFKKPGLFAKKAKPDMALVNSLKANIEAIIEGKEPVSLPEEILGQEKMDEILNQSMQYAKEASLQREYETEPVYDL